jgi:hypothetical protein
MTLLYLGEARPRLTSSMQSTAVTRRAWVHAATRAAFCFSGAELFAASDFWNKKDSSAWTSDEVLQLATRSPWATSARVLPKPGRDRGSFQSDTPAVAGGRSGGRGTGPDPVVAVTEVTVVWESSQPLLDALKSSFPSDFANHYVIGVNDLPTLPGKRRLSQENTQANLRARGKDPVDAGAIQMARGVLLCAFSRELLPLGSADKDILFTLETEQFSVKARFEPKEMIYRGKLAL